MEKDNNIYKTIKVYEQHSAAVIQIYRPEAENSINTQLLKEIRVVLDILESDDTVKVIILEGLPDSFCTGMDLNEIKDAQQTDRCDSEAYYEILKHFSFCSKIIISKIAGKVNAGGIGLIAASDIVLADEKAVFSLSEALFGLLPACVLPFLIRRIGYQKSLYLSITTQSISALRAYELGLVDEVSADLNENLRRNLLRLNRLDVDTIKSLKDFMARLWIIDEQTQKLAVGKIDSLIKSEKVQMNVRNFLERGVNPWNR